MARGPAHGHVVHVERLEAGGVRIWLDGQRVKGLDGWTIAEAVGESTALGLSIHPREVAWGPPPAAAEVLAPAFVAFVDDRQRHFVKTEAGARTTPSGKRACEACGEAWMCSTANRRLELYGSIAVPARVWEPIECAPEDLVRIEVGGDPGRGEIYTYDAAQLDWVSERGVHRTWGELREVAVREIRD